MKDAFAKLFEVGGNGRQLLVIRERDEKKDVTVVRQITEVHAVRIEITVQFTGEKQAAAARILVDAFGQAVAERIYLDLLNLVEGVC